MTALHAKPTPGGVTKPSDSDPLASQDKVKKVIPGRDRFPMPHLLASAHFFLPALDPKTDARPDTKPREIQPSNRPHSLGRPNSLLDRFNLPVRREGNFPRHLQ